MSLPSPSLRIMGMAVFVFQRIYPTHACPAVIPGGSGVPDFRSTAA